MAQLRKEPELELKVALKALSNIKTYGGVICEDCAYGGLDHPECKSSMTTWQTAVTALDKVSQIQSGNYDERELKRS